VLQLIGSAVWGGLQDKMMQGQGVFLQKDWAVVGGPHRKKLNHRRI
jgi:hypothetical protein